MKSRCKLLFMCFTLVLALLMEPLLVVLADETMTEGSYDRNDGPPHLLSSEIKFEKKDFFNWFGMKNIPKENCIEELILAHRKSLSTDYSIYNLVCDFELKTMGTGEAVTTSTYTYKIDMEQYEEGFIDNLLVRFNLKEDYFEHAFDYFEIVKNAEGFEKLDLTGKEKYFTYNTVISQADFYFERKSDGEIGRVRRFKFTWDSDFWLQKCTKIEFLWYAAEEDYEKPIDFIESENGLDGFTGNNSDSYFDLGVSVWDTLLGFFTDLPAAVIAFFSGFFKLSDSLKELILVVFPFIPPGIVSAIILMMGFILVVAVYKMVRGLFG